MANSTQSHTYIGFFNKYYCLIIFMLSFLGFSQNPVPINTNISPRGFLDNVLDNYGNRYNLSDIQYQSSRTLNNGIVSTTTMTTDAGYFKLFFENGSGMDGTSATEIARRAVVTQVFIDISSFIPSPLTTNGLNNKVNIWVRNIANISNVPSAALGLATPFYNMPYNTTTGFGGIADNEIWKTIHLGKDSYTNVAPPITTNSGSNSGTSGVFFHGMMAINFTSYTWNTNLGVLANTSQYDLYTVVLHEVTHALGISSLLDQNGVSLFGTGFNYFSRYDRFLKNNTNTAFLLTNSGTCSLYNYSFNPNTSLITPAVIRPTCTLPNNINTGNTINTTIASNALKFVGTALTNVNIPVYTPVCYEPGSSLSHFEDTNFTPPVGFGFTGGNDLYFTMSNANGMGTNKRYLKKEERLALLELGYSVTATFGISSTLQGTPPVGYYDASTIGITVAGINDGVNSNNTTYTYIGDATTTNPIVINSPTDTSKQILFNDTGATGFECLEDITDNNASFSFTSGILTTNVTFSSSVSGLHLLRYVPFNATGKGNITYIYVYVNDSTVNCAIPNTCNLVMNGDFSQYSAIPQAISQFDKACGWKNSGNNTTPDYFTSQSPQNSFSASIPCNYYGYQNDLNNSNPAYAGMYVIRNFANSFLLSETIKNELSTALLPNTKYQLSFDVSLAEGASTSGITFQAYLASEVFVNAGSGAIPIANPNMLFTNPTYSTSTNNWEKVIFNFTTGAISGEKFLYIGGLNVTGAANTTVQFTPLVPAPNTINGCNYNFETNYNYQPPYNTNQNNQWVQWKTSYYYVDNVKLIPTDATFTLPATICSNGTIPDMRNYLTACPTNGVFNVNGVTISGFVFNASTASVGNNIVTYTFNNNLGCPITLQSTIIVTPAVAPTFNTIPVLCQGGTPPVLPTTSTNGISGTWSPSTISTAASGNYTFTPTAGQCANAVSVAVQVLSNTAFITNTDAFTVTLGSYVTTSVTTPTVLINDTYNGGAIPTTIAGIPYSIVLTGTAPTIPTGGITFNAATGTFTVLPNTTAGTYVYKYYLQNNCYNTAVTTVKIVVNSMIYENKIGLSFCYGTTAVNSGTTLYQGTKINGIQTDATNATISLVAPTTTLPAGITSISPNGSINLAAGVLPGEITFYYTICSTSYGSCTVTKTCVVTIERTFFGNPDTITAQVGGGVNNYNVHSNDTYRGGCGNTNLVPATSSNTTITSVVNAVINNITYYSINQSTGAIQPGNLGTIPSGTYILSYTLCDNTNLNICQTVSVQITVPASKMSNNNTNSKIFDIEKTVVAPNPSNGIFTIYFNTLIEEANIEVFSIIGQKVFEKVLKNTNEEQLSLNQFASGTYLLKINTNEQSIIKRIIKE